MWDNRLAAAIVVTSATAVIVVAVYGEDNDGGDKDGPEIIVGIGIAVHHKKASLNSGGFPPSVHCHLMRMGADV